QVVLHEQALNKLFDALGPVYGSGSYSMLLMNGTYHWTLEQAHIELSDGAAAYTAKVTVQTGPLNYKSDITGTVTITYAADSNKIIIRITSAVLPLYTKLFGKKVHVKDIDLAEYYKDPFVFDGPLSMTTDMEFAMPDGNVRKVHAVPVNCQVIVKDHSITVPCGVEFITVSIKK
ncbi:MAG TPA: hypothetical protein VNZ86_07535, partial [Bacteroidia bacterium]|nr:hypothetical protein [Bacteroidia bacterium]